MLELNEITKALDKTEILLANIIDKEEIDFIVGIEAKIAYCIDVLKIIARIDLSEENTKMTWQQREAIIDCRRITINRLTRLLEEQRKISKLA